MVFKFSVFFLWLSVLFPTSPALFESLCFCCVFPLTELRCRVIATSIRSHLAQAAPQVQVFWSSWFVVQLRHGVHMSAEGGTSAIHRGAGKGRPAKTRRHAGFELGSR